MGCIGEKTTSSTPSQSAAAITPAPAALPGRVAAPGNVQAAPEGVGGSNPQTGNGKAENEESIHDRDFQDARREEEARCDALLVAFNGDMEFAIQALVKGWTLEQARAEYRRMHSTQGAA